MPFNGFLAPSSERELLLTRILHHQRSDYSTVFPFFQSSFCRFTMRVSVFRPSKRRRGCPAARRPAPEWACGRPASLRCSSSKLKPLPDRPSTMWLITAAFLPVERRTPAASYIVTPQSRTQAQRPPRKNLVKADHHQHRAGHRRVRGRHSAGTEHARVVKPPADGQRQQHLDPCAMAHASAAA